MTGLSDMMSRSRSETVVFRHAFKLRGVDRILMPGSYRVATEEELIEGLSFPAWRRTSTVIFVPGHSSRCGIEEMISIDPKALASAMERDSVGRQGVADHLPADSALRSKSDA
jgi:hypothetical protein